MALETSYEDAMLKSEVSLLRAEALIADGYDEMVALARAQVGIGWALYAQAKKVSP